MYLAFCHFPVTTLYASCTSPYAPYLAPLFIVQGDSFRYRDISDEVFMVTCKYGTKWSILMFGRRKRRAFDMQFHPIVVSIFLKTHGDRSSRLLERRI